MFADCFTQNSNEVINSEDGMLVITIDKRNTDEYKNLLFYFGLNEDSLFNYGNIGQLAKDGWVLYNRDSLSVLIAKPLNADAQKINWGNQPIFFDMQPTDAGMPGYPVPVAYGLNNFKKFLL
jgi:hypothetical protein